MSNFLAAIRSHVLALPDLAKFAVGVAAIVGVLMPAAVALMMPKPWVIGTLARQLWSVAGPSNCANVSQLLL